MTPEEARQFIGVEEAAAAREIDEAFRHRSQEIESKIERAPTPALKEKYRRRLDQTEEAWEVLNGTNSTEDLASYPSLRPVFEERVPPPLSAKTPDLVTGKFHSPQRAKRPVLVWIISIFYLIGAGGALLNLSVRLHFVNMGPRFQFQGETTLDYIVHTASSVQSVLTVGIGGVFLLLLRRIAFYFLTVNFGFTILFTIFNMVTTTPSSTQIVLVMVSYGLNIAILLYPRSLIRKDVLT